MSVFRKFEFRTGSITRCKKWESILQEKGIKYEDRASTLCGSTTYIFTIQADDEYYADETDISDWELYGSNFANLKYICGLLCIPYDDVTLNYRE